MVETILLWVQAHGYPALAVLLGVGILGLPVPDETLLIFAGVLAQAGTLKLAPVLVAAVLGSWCGITVSYLVGRIGGRRLLVSISRRFPASRRHLSRARAWDHRYGGWALTFGYFVPGVRHFTSILAGSLAMPWRQFIFFAYSGGLVWVVLFVMIGYLGGDQWLAQSARYRMDVLIAIGVCLVFLAIILWAKNRIQIPVPPTASKPGPG